MSQKGLVSGMINQLNPKRRPGALPRVTPCPYCGMNMSQTDHARHRRGCAVAHKQAPPQAAEFAQDPGGGYNPDGTFPQT